MANGMAETGARLFFRAGPGPRRQEADGLTKSAEGAARSCPIRCHPPDPAAVPSRRRRVRRLIVGYGDVSYAAAGPSQVTAGRRQLRMAVVVGDDASQSTDGCRQLRMAVAVYGWLSPTTDGCRSLRRRVAVCGWLSPTADGCRSLRLAVANYGGSPSTADGRRQLRRAAVVSDSPP
jgi:hypothetical protein